MSVQTTNRISQAVLAVGLEPGAVAWAAHWLNNPIGAVGGAVFGAVRCVSQIPLGMLGVPRPRCKKPPCPKESNILKDSHLLIGGRGVCPLVQIGE
jgi:hypothetical protein